MVETVKGRKGTFWGTDAKGFAEIERETERRKKNKENLGKLIILEAFAFSPSFSSPFLIHRSCEMSDSTFKLQLCPYTLLLFLLKYIYFFKNKKN